MTLEGPHCNHDETCGWFGCDQRSHIDFPCKQQATCTYCQPTAPCPTWSHLTVAECSDCRVDRYTA